MEKSIQKEAEIKNNHDSSVPPAWYTRTYFTHTRKIGTRTRVLV